MAKKSAKIKAQVKVQIPGGKATPAPPVGTALGPHGINLGQFVSQFNDKTRDLNGMIVPVVITIFEDRSFSFVLKSPPASVLLKQAAQLAKGCAQCQDRKSRPRDPGAAQGNREDENGRLECDRHGRGVPDHCRHRPQHGNRSGGLG